MNDSWTSPKQVVDEMNFLLPQMALLFNGPRGARLTNGNVDIGFNCMAKAYVAMYLARLRGLAVDLCFGEAIAVEKWPKRHYAQRISPHGWVAAPSVNVIDLSIRDFQTRRFLPIVKGTAYDWNPWSVMTTSAAADVEQFLASRQQLPDGAFLLYWLKEVRPFNFDGLALGGMDVDSKWTHQTSLRYRGNNVVAKAILHLHQVVKGVRLPLVAGTQKKAWDELARWNIDAVGELRTLLLNARTLHAAAGWDQNRKLRLNPQVDSAFEAPAPPCCLAS